MSEKFIITAAHCTYGTTSGDFFVGLGKCCNEESLKIYLEGPVNESIIGRGREPVSIIQ